MVKIYQEEYKKRHLDIQKKLTDRFGGRSVQTLYENDELVIILSKAILLKVLSFLKDDKDFQFKQLIDICGVDYPDRLDRFEIVYHLLSISLNQRVRVKLSVNDEETVPSIVTIYDAANWYEREVWDLFGIIFTDHPDLRRILTDYGFEGHPLRKDFPLSGFIQVKYDDSEKKVVNEKVSLVQDFRKFDFESPWEGPDYNEKDKNMENK